MKPEHMLTSQVQPKFSASRLEAIQQQLKGRSLFRVHLSQRAVFGHEYVRDPNKSQRQNIRAYEDHQIAHRHVPMAPQGVFPLVRFLARLDRFLPESFRAFPLAEFNIASENSYGSGERFESSLDHYGIPVNSSSFTEGDSPIERVNARKGDVFFSGSKFGYDEDENRVPALRVLPVFADPNTEYDQYAIVWDWDATIAHQGSEAIFQDGGVAAFEAHELRHRRNPMRPGPVAALFGSALILRALFDEPKQTAPFINIILTARSDAAGRRVRATLPLWTQNAPFPLAIDDYNAVTGGHKGDYMRALVNGAFATNGRHLHPILLDDSGPNANKAAEAGFPAAVVPTSARR